MIPSVLELTYFLEITRTLNFTRAAKNLYISQPALTRCIQNLEKKVGAELFIRHKNGLVITRAGKKILLSVKPLFEYWKNTQLEAVSLHNQIQGSIKIGCHSTIGIFMHGIMKEMLENHPQLDIEIFTSTSTKISQRVIDLDIDIGIVSVIAPCPDLIIRKISETQASLWVGEVKHKIQDIHSGEAVLICNPEYHFTQAMLQKCKNEKINFKRVFKANSMEVIASLTANGCGIGILPIYLTQYLYPDKLTRVSKAPFVVDSLYLIYRKEYVNVQAIKTVISAIQNSIKK